MILTCRSELARSGLVGSTRIFTTLKRKLDNYNLSKKDHLAPVGADKEDVIAGASQVSCTLETMPMMM